MPFTGATAGISIFIDSAARMVSSSGDCPGCVTIFLTLPVISAFAIPLPKVSLSSADPRRCGPAAWGLADALRRPARALPASEPASGDSRVDHHDRRGRFGRSAGELCAGSPLGRSARRVVPPVYAVDHVDPDVGVHNPTSALCTRGIVSVPRTAHVGRLAVALAHDDRTGTVRIWRGHRIDHLARRLAPFASTPIRKPGIRPGSRSGC